MAESGRLLITGASGQLGSYLLRAAAARRTEVIAWSGTQTGERHGFRLCPVDFTAPDRIREAWRQARPGAIIHAAALASVALCRQDPELAHSVNVRGTSVLAELAAHAGTRLVLVSTDLVFDGEKGGYREGDDPKPLSVYGKTKLAAEEAVLAYPGNTVVRVSLLFGPSLGRQTNFFDQQLTALRERTPIRLFADEWRTPIGMPFASQALLEIARSQNTGILHLGGPDRMSRLEMGLRLARYLGLGVSSIIATNRDAAPSSEPRPRDTSLDSSCWRARFPGSPWPTFEQSLAAISLPANAGRCTASGS
ncbi:MAG TPA: SDR family oxidoreductase [Gemmataceae bacterium]|jgi:dTDP-4-dehydrorhamnose reductase|nr:SDR family oxidoreductase [Gemmataceae bacterium]